MNEPTSTEETHENDNEVQRMKQRYQRESLAALIKEKVHYERVRDGKVPNELPRRFIQVNLLALEELLYEESGKSSECIDRFLEAARRAHA